MASLKWIKTLTSDENGYLDFNGIAPGACYLKEESVPKGYVKSDEILTVTIPERADAHNVAHIQFANVLVPKTGGSGAMMFTVFGTAMTLLALGYWAMTRKQREQA